MTLRDNVQAKIPKREDAWYVKSHKTHAQYEDTLKKLEKKLHLSPAEEIEKVRLKKLKLALKDEMEKFLMKP